jgi:hypothetical protein
MVTVSRAQSYGSRAAGWGPAERLVSGPFRDRKPAYEAAKAAPSQYGIKIMQCFGNFPDMFVTDNASARASNQAGIRWRTAAPTGVSNAKAQRMAEAVLAI